MLCWGIAKAQSAARISPTVELHTVLQLTAPLTSQDEQAVMETGRRLADLNGLKAPEGAEKGALWPMQQGYFGSRSELLLISQSSFDYVVSLSKLPNDPQTYDGLAAQIEQSFAPLGFKRQDEDGR